MDGFRIMVSNFDNACVVFWSSFLQPSEEKKLPAANSCLLQSGENIALGHLESLTFLPGCLMFLGTLSMQKAHADMFLCWSIKFESALVVKSCRTSCCCVAVLWPINSLMQYSDQAVLLSKQAMPFSLSQLHDFFNYSINHTPKSCLPFRWGSSERKTPDLLKWKWH